MFINSLLFIPRDGWMLPITVLPANSPTRWAIALPLFHNPPTPKTHTHARTQARTQRGKVCACVGVRGRRVHRRGQRESANDHKHGCQGPPGAGQTVGRGSGHRRQRSRPSAGLGRAEEKCEVKRDNCTGGSAPRGVFLLKSPMSSFRKNNKIIMMIWPRKKSEPRLKKQRKGLYCLIFTVHWPKFSQSTKVTFVVQNRIKKEENV